MNKYVLGIDVGGTNVKLGLTNAQGRVIARTHFSTKTFLRSKVRLIKATVAAVQRILQENRLTLRHLKGVGVGLPGLVDPYRGVVKFLPNIPGWKNVPLSAILRQYFKLPVIIENDVNLITLGEWKFGAGINSRDMVCLTLGTGVGAGLVLDNRLYRGPGFVAGEIGHIPINEQGPACNCGGFGCLERYVGNRFLRAKAAAMFKRPGMQIEDVFALANKGDQRALRFWQETAVHIGNALTGVVNLLNPRRIIIGGGVANNEKFLFKTIERTIKSRAMKVQAAMFKIVRTKLGDDAGIIGAQVLITEGL